MDDNKLESSFSVDNLILLQSHFSRITNVHFDDEVQNHLDIKTDVSVREKQVTVILSVTITQQYHGEEQLNCQISMAGLFTSMGEEEINKDLEKFGKINGAAIIFPYIREHVSNLSVKAGLPPIILSPINFTKNE